MTPLLLLVPLGAGAALVTFAVIYALLGDSRRIALEVRVGADSERPQSLVDDELLDEPLTTRVLKPLLRGAGRLMLRLGRQGQLDKLQGLMRRSGMEPDPPALLGRKVVGGICGIALGIGFVLVMQPDFPLPLGLPLAFAGLGYVLPEQSVKRRARHRERAIRRALPGVADLLTICIEAGLTLDGAMTRLVESDTGPLAEEFRQMLMSVRLGQPRMQALLALADRCQVAELTVFCRSIAQAEPLGVGVADVLRIQAEELRRMRRQRAEETGHKAPIKMLLPMVGCILPTIFLVLLGPAAISLLSASH